jgi:hypothetical protein
MVGQVIRAVEGPISLSISVAQKSVELTGRVAGWALTEITRKLSPGVQDEAFEPAAEEYSASTRGPVHATEEPAPVTRGVAVSETAFEEPEAVAVSGDEPGAAAVTEEEPEAAAVTEDEQEAAAPTPPVHFEAETPPGVEAEPPPVGGEAEPPPMGGEEGAVVEHEPGIGTSVRARDPHSPLNNPVSEPDMTEWPDPYDHREDPRDPGEEMVFGGEGGHTQTGATSTSEPHPSQDPEADAWEGPKRDKVDQ